MMPGSTPRLTWIIITLAMVVLTSVIIIAAMVRRVPPSARMPAAMPENIVMRQEQRMTGVRAALEVRGVRGRVGYLADVPADGLRAHPRGMEEYFLAQFALVPCVLVLDPQADTCRWIVANLHASDITARSPAGFRIAREFSDGVWLLERDAP